MSNEAESQCNHSLSYYAAYSCYYLYILQWTFTEFNLASKNADKWHGFLKKKNIMHTKISDKLTSKIRDCLWAFFLLKSSPEKHFDNQVLLESSVFCMFCSFSIIPVFCWNACLYKYVYITEVFRNTYLLSTVYWI